MQPLLPRLPAAEKKQLAYILGRHGLFLDLTEGPAAVEDEELREQLQQIIRCEPSWVPCRGAVGWCLQQGVGPAAASSGTGGWLEGQAPHEGAQFCGLAG